MADEVKETVGGFTSEVAASLVGAADETAETPPEAQEGAAEAVSPDEPGEASEGFSLDIPELPEELAIELAEAEAEAEPDPEPEVEAEEDDGQDWYQDDTEVRRLKAELAKSKKREKYLEEQRIKSGTPAWRAEAAEYFPLAEKSGALDRIAAKSKREFLRQAKARHEEILPAFEAMKSEFESQLAAAKEKMEEEVTSKVQEAWGIPTNVPGTAPEPASSSRDRIQSVRKSRDLVDAIKARL